MEHLNVLDLKTYMDEPIKLAISIYQDQYFVIKNSISREILQEHGTLDDLKPALEVLQEYNNA